MLLILLRNEIIIAAQKKEAMLPFFIHLNAYYRPSASL